jgi:hypothetical protein
VGKGSSPTPDRVAKAYQFGPGDRLADRSTGDPATAPGDRAATEEAMAALLEELASMQERLYAEGVGGGQRSLLLLLQGWTPRARTGRCAASWVR